MNYAYHRSLHREQEHDQKPKINEKQEKNIAKYIANTQNQNKIITCQFQTAYGFRYIGLNVNLKFILFFESLRHNKVGNKKMI